MPPKINLVGQRFGRLTVIKEAGKTANNSMTWECLCDCGTKATKLGTNLTRGLSQSCGCLRAELRVATNTRHSGSTLPEYAVWKNMIRRCENPARQDFRNYGGRGIAVCERWRESFANFLQDIGHRPSSKHSIERRDNDGPYSPENCYWATDAQQRANKRPRHR